MNTSLSMRAAVATGAGAPLAITEVPRPGVGARQVLVQIKAAGLNPLDTKIRAGKADHARHPLPAVLGIDLAGVVVAVGEGVTGFAAGDAVYGMTGGVGGIQGSLAQFAAVDADLLARQPAHLSMRDAASLPLGFITAWEGLVDRAQATAGMKVLVHGGGGGVGQLAVQLARARGAQVFATGSAEQKAAIEALGATHIDYRNTPVAEYVQTCTAGEGFDVVFDTVGGTTLDASFQAVRIYHGRVVSVLGWGTHSLAPLSFRAATYSGVFTLLPLLTGKGRAHHGEILREATRLVEQGKLRPRVDPRHFSLDEVNEAFRAVEEGSAAGKIVVEIGA